VKNIIVYINPILILSDEDSTKIGVHINKNIFKTAFNIPSINPMHNTSIFFNSFKALKNIPNVDISLLLSLIFSSHKKATIIELIAAKKI
jgi:hypothetical protein